LDEKRVFCAVSDHCAMAAKKEVLGFIGVLIVVFTVGCGTAHKGVTANLVRPTLETLPYDYQLRETDFDGTKATYVGTAHANNGARVDFAVSVCGGADPCFDVPSIPGDTTPGVATTGGTGWAYLDNGTYRRPGETKQQLQTAIKMGAQIFVALCQAGHDEPCV
jgi:hypothetical protein